MVDDGSSDWTQSVCKRLGDQLPLRYFRIENSGISAAKNLGLFVSEAPLVLFFDDDDLADAGLLEAHVEAHRAHPDESVAVLGYTTWAPELEITPLMEYVTEIGQQLFFYRSLEDGETLDHTYFWGGRSSCKRSFLAKHGTFDQELPAMEDIELGFRLSRHGLKVVYDALGEELHAARGHLRRVRAAVREAGPRSVALQPAPRRSRRRALLPRRRGAREVAAAGAVAGGEDRAGPRARAAPFRRGRARRRRPDGAPRALLVDLRRPAGARDRRGGRGGSGRAAVAAARRFRRARHAAAQDLPRSRVHHRLAEVGDEHPRLVACPAQRAVDRGRVGHLLLPAQGRSSRARLRDLGRAHRRLLARQPRRRSRAVPRPPRPRPQRAAHRDHQRPPVGRSDPGQHARRRSARGDVPGRALPPHPQGRAPGRPLDGQLPPHLCRSGDRRADEKRRPAAAVDDRLPRRMPDLDAIRPHRDATSAAGIPSVR